MLCSRLMPLVVLAVSCSEGAGSDVGTSKPGDGSLRAFAGPTARHGLLEAQLTSGDRRICRGESYLRCVLDARLQDISCRWLPAAPADARHTSGGGAARAFDAHLELHWDQLALDAALSATPASFDGRIPGVEYGSFLPSLYLNLAASHERVGDLDAARQQVSVALCKLDLLGSSPLADLTRGAVVRLGERLGVRG